MAQTYQSTDELDGKTQTAFETILYDGEPIETGILCYVSPLIRAVWLGSGFYKRFVEKLILTDRRLIAFKAGWIREKSDDFALDEITSIGYTKGIFWGKVEIQGAGFEETYRVPKNAGREFVSTVREHLQKE